MNDITMEDLHESHPDTAETRESLVTAVGLLVLTLCDDGIVCPRCNGYADPATHDKDCVVGEALKLIKKETR